MPTIRTGTEWPQGAATQNMRRHVYATITADEAEQWIEDNVTNLASAKVALKHIIRMLIYLRDYVRIMEDR